MLFRTKIGKYLFRKFFAMIGRKDIAKIPPNYFFPNWFFQRVLGINSGIRFQVHFTSRVQGDQFMELGVWPTYCMAVQGCCNIVVVEGTKLIIGEDTIFARNICIRTANHDLIDRSQYTKADVVIGTNCWLGHGAAIMPGVQLGNNVTVGANAVVTKSFPDNVVIGGVPAKIIKTLHAESPNSDQTNEVSPNKSGNN
jgi:carbonic anhydrase/acetyltransferase-like protein (isoleucine patch superfamily)